MTEMKQTMREEYDVVVIGSGFAGLSAALEAKQAGKSVVVLEKMTIPGGNSAISGGLLAVAGSPLQERDGIKDTTESMFADMMKAGLGINHPELARMICEKSVETLRWTLSLGVEYKDNINHLGGHSVPRTYNTTCGTGSGILQPLLSKCRELEIPIQLKTRFRQFVLNDDGRVRGVTVMREALISDDEAGTPDEIHARKAVVLACGGFGSDVAFRLTQDPRLTEVIDSTNHRGATAEGLMAAMKIGAIPIHLSWIQLGPGLPLMRRAGGRLHLYHVGRFSLRYYGRRQNGKRFVNEMSDRRLRTDAMLFSDRIPVAIVDSLGVQYATTLDKCIKRGVVQKFNTLEELATYNSIPLFELRETLERYRLSLIHGRDIEFGKPLSKDLKPIENPPYYSIRLLPKVHHCMGGVQINTRAQVLRLPDYQPIEGLYAAGEITGGIHGASRLGSNAILDCLVFGRIAGREAALS